MLYHLGMMLSHKVSVLHVFKYLTFRTGGATLTALLISFFMGPSLIRWLKSRQAEGQPIRQDGPESHFAKKGTPTMGGILILFALLTSTLLWVDWSNRFVWIVIACTMGFGCIGAVDDYLKLTKRNSKGVSGRMKLILQCGIALVVSLLIVQNSIPSLAFHLTFPFFKEALLDLGWFYIVFSVVVVVGASNAVNLTDGLDGLAIVPIMTVAACFCLISYLVGNFVFANYLQLHFTPGSGELAVFSGALVGAGLGFLWFNAPPAMVFMGDTGSLAVGAALGAISVVTKHEIVLAITGGLFVIEAVSVMMQVGYFKLTRRRIFLMAPIHHHFEKKGWSEPTVVIRFWIISFVFALIGLSTLKLR